jgi:hypothetical protein
MFFLLLVALDNTLRRHDKQAWLSSVTIGGKICQARIEAY